MSKLSGWENEIKSNDILSIQLNLLNKCTSKCRSCRKYTWPDDTMSLSDVENTLTVLRKKFNLQTVVFSGGDPILYKDFDKVIDICERLGIKYSMITTLISKNKELLEKIAKTAYRLHVSIDAVDDNVYKKIRGVDAFPIVRDNVRFINTIRIKEDKIPIRISATISKMNYSQVVRLYSFAQYYDCTLNYYFIHTWDDLKMTDDEEKEFYSEMEFVALSEKYKEYTTTNSRAILAARYEYETESSRCKKCYLPHINCTINANGDIYPCCKLLDDNGEYGMQKMFAYGNVCGKTPEELVEQFNRRLKQKYPLGCELCNECGDRYNGVLSELEEIIECGNGNRKPLFL